MDKKLLAQLVVLFLVTQSLGLFVALKLIEALGQILDRQEAVKNGKA